jgi:hypothetical protein
MRASRSETRGQSLLFDGPIVELPTPATAPPLSEEAVGSPPDSSWRWLVAAWEHSRWLAWLRRSDELLRPGALVPEIRAARWRAYRELSRVDAIPEESRS